MKMSLPVGLNPVRFTVSLFHCFTGRNSLPNSTDPFDEVASNERHILR
jgi:hypothetical protein